MDHKKLKKIIKDVQQKQKQAHIRRKIIINPTTWRRVNESQQYEKDDIVAVASCLLDTHGYSFEEQVRVLSGEEQLKQWLQSIENFDVHQNAYFCLYQTQRSHWVVFSILKRDSNIFILYKDSHGADIVPEIQNTIDDKFTNHEFKIHLENNDESEDSCSLMCLKNLEIILEGLNENKGEFIEQFMSTEFCSSHLVSNIRKKFQAKLQHYVSDNIILWIDELSNENEFKTCMNDFIEKCTKYVDVTDDLFSYTDESLRLLTTEPDSNLHDEKIMELRGKFFENPVVQELINTTSVEPSNDSNTSFDENGRKNEIEEKFPEQMKTFQTLFSWIINYKDSAARDDFLRKVSDTMGLEYNKIQLFFEIQRRREERRMQETEARSSEELPSVEVLVQEMQKEPVLNIPETAVKSMDQLLKELVVGDTWKAKGGEELNRDGIKTMLRRVLSDLHQARDRRKEDLSSIDVQKEKALKIRKWATDRRMQSSQKEGEEISEKEVVETLAIICCAHWLVTGGQELRDTQLIAALLCLLDENGNLCQMATGEGKTAVISMLAAAEVLLHNRPVDIITSNHVLAYEGFKSRRIFYVLLGITVSCSSPKHEKTVNIRGMRPCYRADIVYGDINNFQFDYLRHHFEQYGTRGDRSFGRVIADEVDSLLIDRAAHIAKLCSPFPGMDSLRYILIKIWVAICKSENEMGNAIDTKLKNKAEEIEQNVQAFNQQQIKDLSACVQSNACKEVLEEKNTILQQEKKSFLQACDEEYVKYKKKVFEEEIDKIKQRIKDINSSELDIIPSHLRPYAKKMEDQWIENALLAKYNCFEDGQYVLRTDDVSKNSVLVPVDWKNTGVTQKNTVLSGGLQQFIQIKHNIRVTTEALTSCYISNVSYIKMYGKHIWGLTGTLGLNAETQLFVTIYEVSYSKIPTYRKKMLIEYNGLVVPNDRWANVVTADAVLRASNGRSVLIICKTINDVKLLDRNVKAMLNMRKIENITVKTYFDEDSSEIVEDVLGPHVIIIATNIAGRGTDLRTNKSLEANGGLHVCIAFLPANKRVQDQAEGRTGRQGNMGSAQMILCYDDVFELDSNLSPYTDFGTILKTRDDMEETRVLKVQNEELKVIEFQDAIFNKFCNVYANFRKKAKENLRFIFLAMDLNEMWAFWLNEKDFSKTEKTVDEEFQDFLQKAERILGKNENGTFNGGDIAFNPYYSIHEAEYFLHSGSIEKSEKALLHAINLDPENSHILYAAYFKLFEVEMEKGHQLLERFKKAMKDICYITSTQKDETYKTRAKNALEKAIKALKKEMYYIKINFMGNNDGTDFQTNQSKSKSNEDFINILDRYLDNNPLVTQLSSRYAVLSSYHQHAVNLLTQIEESSNVDGSITGLAIVSRASNYLKDPNPTIDSKSPKMLEEDLSEIGKLGLDTMYAVREIHDVPGEIISAARRQILAGLAVAGSGICFPPALIITGPLSSTLISEGICDIVIEVINQGYGKFSEEVYVRGKVISYAISAITLGVSVLCQCVSVLERAIKCCKSLSSILRKCPHMQSVCKKLASIIDSLGKYFQRLKYLSQMNKLNKVTLSMSKMELVGSVIRNSAKTTMRSLMGSVITEKIVNAQLNIMLMKIKPDIEEFVEKTVKARITKEDLSDISTTDLQYQMNVILGTYTKSDILIDVVLGLLRHSSSWYAKLTSIAIDTGIFSRKIYKYTETLCEKIKEENSAKSKEERLKNIKQSEGGKTESFEDLQNIIIKALSDKIYSLLMQIAGKYINTFTVNPVMNNFWNLLDSSAKINRKAEEESNKKFYEISEALELLGLDYGATDEEINRAYDQSMAGEGNTEQFIRVTEARNILHDLNKQVAYYEVLCNSKEPAHRGNIETLSKECKRHIVIHINETGDTREFGTEYKDNGNPTMNVRYEPPSEDGYGHYSVMETDRIEVQASGGYNCFYDVYAAICKSEGIDMTSDHARSIAEKYSWANLYYGSLNSVSEGFNNDIMKKMYLDSKTSLLVGGNEPNTQEETEKGNSNTEGSVWDYVVEYPDAYFPFLTD